MHEANPKGNFLSETGAELSTKSQREPSSPDLESPSLLTVQKIVNKIQLNNGINLLFESLSNQKYTIGPHAAKEHVLLKNISQSIVVQEIGIKPYSVHVKGCSELILSLHTTGPVFIHDVHDAVLIIRSHQLRLHNISQCTILAEVSNDRLVIENCDGLRIGSFPLFDSRVKVDDFSWPNKTHNPHYEYISKEQYDDKGVAHVFDWLSDVAEGAVDSDTVLGLVRRV